MGYTHYFNRPVKLEKKAYAKFSNDVKEIVAKSDVTLANGSGDFGSEPTITEELISLNGSGENSHETIYIPRELTKGVDYFNMGEDKLPFQFCKTAQKPYDKVVVEILKAFKKHFPKVELSSDGGEEIFA